MVDFKKALSNLEDIGFNPVPNRVVISVPDAKVALWKGIRFFAGDSASWQPEYNEVAKWLTDNKGRGLLCIGNCGRGKTLICGKIIPVLLNHHCNKVVSCYDAQQLNADLDAVKQKHIIYVDDIGTEFLSVKYGEKRLSFAELVDEAEKKGKLLIITTNLSLSELQQKYGERTVDRLRAITTPVVFKGDSLRK
jgi:DNA replication protein DnaC